MRPVRLLLVALVVLIGLLACGVADAGCRGGVCGAGPALAVRSRAVERTRTVERGSVRLAARSVERTMEATRATLRGTRAVIRWTVRR